MRLKGIDEVATKMLLWQISSIFFGRKHWQLSVSDICAVFLISDQSAITMQSLSTFSSKCSLSMALFLSRER